MGNIGSGSGSSYPTSLDYQSSLEVDSPSPGMTKARAAVPNDIISAVLAMETELGTDPAGSLTDVKTYLQIEHNTDGTHKETFNALTSTTATNIAMNGEGFATSSSSPVTLDLGTVSTGDRIFVTVSANIILNNNANYFYVIAEKSSGTATVQFQYDYARISNLASGSSSSSIGIVGIPTVSGIMQVTGGGDFGY